MKNPIAKIYTGRGVITVELYPEHAPNTVRSFIWAASEKMYENRLIKRIVPGFVLQPSYCYFDDKRCDYMIEGEFGANGFDNPIEFREGIVAMAGDGEREAHGCEFFITLSDDARARLQGRFAPFGRVIGGMEEVKRLENVETVRVYPNGLEGSVVNQPVEDEYMLRVEIDTFGEEYLRPEIKYLVE